MPSTSTSASASASTTRHPPPNEIYQYSLINALMAGVSNSGITVEQLLQKGNQGLGTFVHMDGELLLLDDTVYQLQAEGRIRVADPKDECPYAVATFFVPEGEGEGQGQGQGITRLASKESVDVELAKGDGTTTTNNLFKSYRIEARFKSLTCRTVKGQERPGESLAELGKRQFVKEYTDIEGTIIGFRSPTGSAGSSSSGSSGSSWQGIFVAGEHMHFIDRERKVGGHVLAFTDATEVKMGIATANQIHIELPKSEEFNRAQMQTDDAGVKAVEG